MKADLTRNTFDPLKHFSRVLMQQGRVELDADWNEQASILLHYLQALAADIIGPQGGPSQNLGFEITAYPPAPANPVQKDFRIGLGVYYVDGIRCEADSTPVAVTVKPGSAAGNSATVTVDHWALDGSPFREGQYMEVFDDAQSPNAANTPTLVQISNPQQAQLTLTLLGAPAWLGNVTAPKLRRVLSYMTQPDYPLPLLTPPMPGTGLLSAAASYLVYLDVWERHITCVEDDSIREVALGGPDTATRAQVVWQVKVVQGTPRANSEKSPCDNFTPTDPNFLAELLGTNRGRLKVRAIVTGQASDPCILPPSARYRGPDNQLYRVEIHRPGPAWDGTEGSKNSAATFKWSREDGSVVFPILSLSSGSGLTTVTLESLGRDDRFGLAEGEWVEVQDDVYILQNRAETLIQIQSIDPKSMTVTLNGVPDSKTGRDSSAHPLLRRWDYQGGIMAEGGLPLGSDSAALIQEGQWLELENGVQIQFQKALAPNGNPLNEYRTSDYWQIPARTATGDVEWPTEADAQGNAVPISKPPDGVAHHYAPLGIVNVDASGDVTPGGNCRKTFGPIAT